jgi:hypothetical protein
MPNSAYVYLLSSLPMLNFAAKTALSPQRFLRLCQDLIPEKDYTSLELCFDQALLRKNPGQATLSQWVAFESGLRNELAKIRASRQKTEAQKYLRQDIEYEAAAQHLASASHRIPHLLESEKYLDQARWQKLEELSVGHHFDLDALIVYALKLHILWRWERINQADKPAVLEDVLSSA